MKTIFEHIEHVKGKPHHVRKRVAFTAAVIGTGLIALVWFIVSIGTGAFAIQDTSFADSTGQGSVIVTSADLGSNSGNSAVAGTAAALSNENAPAHIEIVNTTLSASGQKKAEQTVIPF